MTIHHSQIRKAERLGFTLTEVDDGVKAFWPKRAVSVHAASPADAFNQMDAVMAIYEQFPDVRMEVMIDNPRLVTLSVDGKRMKSDFHTPHAFLGFIHEGAEFALEIGDAPVMEVSEDYVPDHVERLNGIAANGAIAYHEGTPAGDCPYSSEDDEDDDEYDEDDDEYGNFVRWNDEWDEAADEATDEEPGGSVVSESYRAKYAELGHPTHCGDWLANLLNELCLTKAGTDLDRFEAICEANGVGLGKYNRTTAGWQGRLRMTGRNLLAKRVYLAGGVVKTPIEGAEDEYRAPSDWMDGQRFKMPKSQQAKPVPGPDAE